MLWMPCALQKARTSCVLIQSGFRGALARGGLAAQVEWPSCVLACFPAGVALFDSLHALSPPPAPSTLAVSCTFVCTCVCLACVYSEPLP